MIWHLNPVDERLTAERSAIRALYWPRLMLLLAALLAVKAALACMTDVRWIITLPEAGTLAAGLLVPAAVCLVKGLRDPRDEASKGPLNAVFAGAFSGMLVLLVVLDVVTIVLMGGRGGSVALLAGIPVALLWDRCETALFRAGLTLWGGNERRRRGKKRLTLMMLALGALLIGGYLALRISQIDSWKEYWLAGDYDVLIMPVWMCILLVACHGRIVSRRDQGDNIADRLEQRAEREASADEAQ